MNTLHLFKKSLAISITVMLTVIILPSIFGSARAQENKLAAGKNGSTASTQPRGPADSVELEAFLDALMAKDMEENHIAGAAVAVVKDGRLFFAKGYGYADLQNHIPVDPEQTIFRIGSNGKVFTWTAVMQLVEQGKLDLDVVFVWFLNNWNLLGWQF